MRVDNEVNLVWTIEPDGSVIDTQGKVIFFSAERFINDICLGHCCFICGAETGSKPFSEEHIFSEWLLRRFDLFSRSITLPNGGTVRYDRYTVPCCTDCNALLGQQVEQPISEFMKGGWNAVAGLIEKGHSLKLFVWLALIYLKTHLKDRTHRVHLDARKGGAMIADEYGWEHLHHIHCLVRCFYTKCAVEVGALGSFLCVQVENRLSEECFDFRDLYLAQTMLLRLGDIAFLVVFNDAGGALSYFRKSLSKIPGPVSELQLREIMVDLAFLNLHLIDRPVFRSKCDLLAETCTIVVEGGEPSLKALDLSVRGALLAEGLDDALPFIRMSGYTEDEVRDAVKSGTITFLFDEDGKFVGAGKPGSE